MNRTTWQLLVVAGLCALAHPSSAREATPNGLSAALGVEQNLDGSVALASDASGSTSRTGHLDLDLLANVRDLAFGGGLAWAPGILGNGRLLLGGRLGWQPSWQRMRFQLLGEAGMHRFDEVGGNLFGSTNPAVVTLPYLGAQVGMTCTFVDRGHLEYGISLHLRQDLGQETVVKSDTNFFGGPPTVTNYRVGGTMLGATIAIGYRTQFARPMPSGE
jgi:hypothetical protein